MTPNPILKVLSTLNKNKVKSLLIGGQACIIYGASEFSRDSDFVILATPGNIQNLRHALKVLKAKPIFFPPLELGYLERGHACHFKCHAKDVSGLRIDIMTRLRGCEGFDKLWPRRNRIKISGQTIDIINIRDLVQCKKTQRDKDWFMLERLMENDILSNKKLASVDRIEWWLRECRNPSFLMELSRKYHHIARRVITKRPLLSSAISGNVEKLKSDLKKEETLERLKDAEYWAVLRKELEDMRHGKLKVKG